MRQASLKLFIIIALILPCWLKAESDENLTASGPLRSLFPTRERTYSEVKQRFVGPFEQQVARVPVDKRIYNGYPAEDELDELLGPVLRAEEAMTKAPPLERYALLNHLGYEYHAVRLLPLARIKQRILEAELQSYPTPLTDLEETLDWIVKFWSYSGAQARLQPDSRYATRVASMFYYSLVNLVHGFNRLSVSKDSQVELLVDVFMQSTALHSDPEGYLARIEGIDRSLFKEYNFEAYNRALQSVPIPTAGESTALETWTLALLSGYVVAPLEFLLEPLPVGAAFIIGPSVILSSALALFRLRYAHLREELYHSFKTALNARQHEIKKVANQEACAYCKLDLVRPILRERCQHFFE